MINQRPSARAAGRGRPPAWARARRRARAAVVQALYRHYLLADGDSFPLETHSDRAVEELAAPLALSQELIGRLDEKLYLALLKAAACREPLALLARLLADGRMPTRLNLVQRALVDAALAEAQGEGTPILVVLDEYTYLAHQFLEPDQAHLINAILDKALRKDGTELGHAQHDAEHDAQHDAEHDAQQDTEHDAQQDTEHDAQQDTEHDAQGHDAQG